MTESAPDEGLASLWLTRRMEQLIFQSKQPVFLTIVLSVLLIKTGFSSSGNVAYVLRIASNPFVNHFVDDPNAQYLLTNWLNPFVAWLLGVSTVHGFIGLNFLYAVAFFVMFVRHAACMLPARESRVAILILVSLPLPGDLLLVSNLDSLTALLLIGILISRRRWITLILGILLGLQHFEQGMVAMGALLCAAALEWLLLNGRSGAVAEAGQIASTAAVAVLGIALGKIVLVALFMHYDITQEEGRMLWMELNLRRMMAQFTLNPHYIIYSVLGVAWLVAAKFAQAGRAAVPFILVLIGLMALLPFIDDETRVIAVVTFPLIFVYWLTNEPFLRSLGNRFMSELAFLWAIVPWVWVWKGAAQPSAFTPGAYRLLRLVHDFLVPA